MKMLTTVLFAICLLLTGCASQSTLSASQRVAQFEAAAGKPVHSFNYLGSLDGSAGQATRSA